MAWMNDAYIRTHLDNRERWGTVLSLSAIAGSVVLMADHPEHSGWLNLLPLVLGAYGTLFVLVVNCYYKQAEAVAKAVVDDQNQVDSVLAKKWFEYTRSIRILGWMHITAPSVVGALGTIALYLGL